MTRKYGYWGLGLILCFLAACAPVISKAIVEKSDPVLFEDLLLAPEKYTGKVLILGGTIIDLAGSQMEVLQRPMGYRMEPQINDRTDGRFLVQFEQKLDATIFLRGRKITLAAEVVGKETRSLGQFQYTYPLLRVKEYHLWPERGRSSLPEFHFGFGVYGTL